jgi:Flp pilus assembly protein TadG
MRPNGFLRHIRHRHGAAAIEFALLALPFITLMLFVLQMGIYFMAQTSLDTAVLSEAIALRNSIQASTNFVAPATTSVKTGVATSGGALLSTATLAVDVRQLTTLAGGITPIVDGVTDWGSSGSILVLRAAAPVPGFIGPFTSLEIQSIAIIRRPSS